MKCRTTGAANGAAARRHDGVTAAAPVRFRERDQRADGGCRNVEIQQDGVIFERSVAGVRMRLSLALSSYRGVALDLRETAAGPRIAVTLVHRDRDLDVLLFEAADDTDVTAEWLHWSRRFALPLLMADGAGGFTQPFGHLGAMTIGAPAPRRKGSILSGRRPRFLTRRRTGRPVAATLVHREREIIAPD